MDEVEILTRSFESQRARLRAVAYRMLGSRSEAEDAVQEAWLKLAGADTTAVENLGAWLTTVVARVCLDMLRARKARREEPTAAESVAPHAEHETGLDEDVEMADSVGVALLVVLDTLTPAERVAFVLHDLFDVPFEEVAPIVGRSPVAVRQLASRARRRVRGSREDAAVDRERRGEIVSAFLAASRTGDFAALLALLDPKVVLRADAVAVRLSVANRGRGAPEIAAEITGAEAVAETFRGRAAAARPALIDGVPGWVFAPGGRPVVAFEFAIDGGRITEIVLTADPKAIAARTIEAGAEGSDTPQ